MKLGIYGILFIGILFSCSQEKVFLIKNNKAHIYIYSNETQSEDESIAIAEFQKYVKQTTSIDLPISNIKDKNKIAIDIRTSNQIDENSIAFVFDKNKLNILGANHKYTLYAVYEFLEKYFQIRFYSPSVEKIPKLKDVSIPLNLQYTYKTKINVRTVHSNLFYENKNFADKQRVSYEAFPYYVPNARVHTFEKFVPADKYYKTKPQYYAFRNNKRIPTQLCLSNEEVYQIVKREVKKSFEEYPDAKIISVSTNDNTQYCLCEKCSKIDQQEGSPAGIVIRFVNRIAKNFPDKQISTLAYQYTRKAPKTPPAKNVLITLCSIECDRSASIEDKCKDFAADLMDWKKLNANIRIWDYTTQFTNFLAPFPNIHTLKPNIDFFAKNNAKWVFEQHSRNPSELFELRSYLMAKLLWNPDLNPQDIIDDFIYGYYHKAGKYIKKYISLIHKNIIDDGKFFLFLYGEPSAAFHSFLSKENLEKYNEFFDKAEEAVAKNPEILKRVELAGLSIIYATMEACRAKLSAKYSFENMDYVNHKMKKFNRVCQENNIEWMSENSFHVREYLDMYADNINRSKMKNLAKGKKVISVTKPKKYANEDPMTLTDGIFGGGNFGDNWLGYEGNDMNCTIDMEKEKNISFISTKFLKIINHIVFFPQEVYYYGSKDGNDYKLLGKVKNTKPLTKGDKNNETQLFDLKFNPTKVRYVKVLAKNISKAPIWHHGADLPAWIFADEIIIN